MPAPEAPVPALAPAGAQATTVKPVLPATARAIVPQAAAAGKPAGTRAVRRRAALSRDGLRREHPRLEQRFLELDAAFNGADSENAVRAGGAFKSLAVRAGATLRSAWARLSPPGAPTVHAGLRFRADGVEIAVTDRTRTISEFLKAAPREVEEAADRWLARYARSSGAKIVSVGLAGVREPNAYSSRLWLRDDIVPVFLPQAVDARSAAARAASEFAVEDGVEVRAVGVKEQGEVDVPGLVDAQAYRDAVEEADWAELAAEAGNFKGRIAFFSSTPRGGGVALMRHALIRLYRLVGVDARWYVLEPDLGIFGITKRKFHNQLQGVAGSGDELTAGDEKMLEDWWGRNAAKFEKVFRETDVVVIDDYQPSGMIPYIKKANPNARILYRSHIQIQGPLVDRAGTPQRRVWEYLWKNIRLADTFISHPIRAFVPEIVSEAMRVYLPATTDPLDGLNKHLSQRQIDYYLDAYDRRLAKLGQTPIDRTRVYAAQIARFDPSKGIATVLEGYARLRARLAAEGVPGRAHPQLVLAGHGAIDDVQGMDIFRKTMETIRRHYPALAADIKAAPMPAVDQVLNAIRRRSAWLEQLSIAEGFEINVTEAGMKGKAIIGTRTGGIPLQIIDGKTGLLVRPSDAAQTADAMYRLYRDRDYRQRLGARALARRPRVHTIHAAIRWLVLARGAVPADQGLKTIW